MKMLFYLCRETDASKNIRLHTSKFIKSNFKLVDDCLNLARGNYLDINFALSLLHYLDHEEHYLPWKAAFKNLDNISRRFNATESTTYKVSQNIFSIGKY